MIKGIDSAAKLTAKNAADIKNAGYRFVGRYLVPTSGATEWKALTKEEAVTICAAGLQLLVCWETTAGRARSGAAAGAADGRTAFQLARAMGIPSSAIVYFAVDYAPPKTDLPAIAEYLRAAGEAIGAYGLGVYGNFDVIEEMAARGLCKGYWQCVGGSGGKLARARSVYQGAGNQIVAGVTVDINECSDMGRAGMFLLPSEKEEETVDTFRSIAEMPDWARPTIRKLCEKGFLQGNTDRKDSSGYPADLNLSLAMLRIFVVIDRTGLFS